LTVATKDMLGHALSLSVIAVALGLGLWQWLDRRRRPAGLSPADEAYFHNQDVRRWGVFVLMLGLGILLWIGTRVAPQFGQRPTVTFVEAWVAILGIVVLLLLLALLDWVATSRYARRHRHAMAREGLAILRDELRRRAALPPRVRRDEPDPAPDDDLGDQAG
jgi:uncharacterized iron-regulated membrane protein